ncbi:hypothetical protein CTI14_11230 [Methylobacterium radiotolerans]|nr:hypothetical protein CTI14_11230 [Methylobacterium radiotolerans]
MAPIGRPVGGRRGLAQHPRIPILDNALDRALRLPRGATTMKRSRETSIGPRPWIAWSARDRAACARMNCAGVPGSPGAPSAAVPARMSIAGILDRACCT